MWPIIRNIARTGLISEPPPEAELQWRTNAQWIESEMLRILGRALTIRHVDAVGDCGCTGGVFGESYASCGRVANVIPVDVAVPGCPPTPIDLLKGILAAVDRRMPSTISTRPGSL